MVILCAGFMAMLLLTLLTVAPSESSSLRHAAGEQRLIGAAIMAARLDHPPSATLIATHFNSLTAENEMKPIYLQPEPGVFTFERADRLVRFAQQHGMRVIGHTLVWHNQTPAWMFQDPAGQPLPRDVALENLRGHIHAVVTHFRGKIRGWDVVNEAISDQGEEYLRDTPALRAIGPDYIIKAFQFAHEADPEVELYYNDYNIEQPGKREKTLRLIRELRQAGVRLDAVGIQGHWSLNGPPVQVIDDALVAFIAQGVRVEITELDIDVLPRVQQSGGDLSATERQGADPYRQGLPDDIARSQAQRYAELFELFLRHPKITRVTFWGVDDGNTWLNDFPVRGRTNHPLLFDRELQPKPALEAVGNVLRECSGTSAPGQNRR